MASRAGHVKQRVMRKRRPGKRASGSETSAKTYKVVAISLHTDQAASVDQTTEQLHQAGYPKASRSLIIQAAISRLQEELAGKTQDEILRYFAEHQVKRTLAYAKSRQNEPPDRKERFKGKTVSR
jgi:hypothetical protein